MLKRRGNFNQIYRNPLPVTLVLDHYGQLPFLTVHNPVSWAVLAWRLFVIYSHLPPKNLTVEVNLDRLDRMDDPIFAVADEAGMASLWRLGFFGKGTLSRSEPSWKARTEQRLGILENSNEVTREDVTAARREERKAFKTVRHEAQKLEELARIRKLSSEEQEKYKMLVAEMDAIKTKKEAMESMANNVDSSKHPTSERRTDEQSALDRKQESFGADVARDDIRTEDLALIDSESNTLKQNLETLQLQKVEAFFLHFALDAIDIKEREISLLLEEIFNCCIGSLRKPDSKFLLDYVVYHHFRSLGWCVRSGIKFGCDMLLYKRGPPMLHAEFAILVVPDGGCGWTEWQDFMALARVVGGVRKTLVLVFVKCPEKTVFDRILLAKIDKRTLVELFRNYEVTEVVYKRWSPSRTRD